MPLHWHTHDGRRLPPDAASHSVYVALSGDTAPHYTRAILRGAQPASNWSWRYSSPTSRSNIIAYAIDDGEPHYSISPWHEHNPANGCPFGDPTKFFVQTISDGENAARTKAHISTIPSSFMIANSWVWTTEPSPGNRVKWFRVLIPEGAPNLAFAAQARPARARLTTAQTEIVRTLDPWARREYSNQCLGRYRLAPWHAEPWAQHPPADPRFLHFIHYSEKQTGLLAYTPQAPADKTKNIRVPIKAGRYLQRFYSETLTPEQIKSWAAKVRGAAMTLHTTKDPSQIYNLYARVGQACMSHSAGHYKAAHLNGGLHPTAVYGTSPDLAVAYILEEGQTDPKYARARCVIWPDRKIHTRIYGDSEAMIETLTASGYRSGLLDGARLPITALSDRAYFNCTTCPYIDHLKWARLDPKTGFLILQDRATGATHSVQHGDGLAYRISDAPKRPIQITAETVAQEHARLVALETTTASPSQEAPSPPPPPPPQIVANITTGQSRPGIRLSEGRPSRFNISGRQSSWGIASQAAAPTRPPEPEPIMTFAEINRRFSELAAAESAAAQQRTLYQNALNNAQQASQLTVSVSEMMRTIRPTNPAADE